MITKKLIHDIIVFYNTYINNENVVFKIAKFSKYVFVCISICKLHENDSIDYCIGSIDKIIYTKEDFIKYKQEVLEKLPKLLEQLKEN